MQPTHCFLEMEIEYVNTRLLTRGALEARIIKVNSPTQFWVHIGKAREYLDELVDDLTHRMKRKGHLLHLLPHSVNVGDAVAIREGKHWQRGIVATIRGNTVAIALLDWGRSIIRSIHEIFQLERQFRDLGWLAIPCGLSHVQPVAPQEKWSPKTKKLAKLLMEKREGWMKIRSTPTDQVALIDFSLKPRSEDSDEITDLRKQLILVGHAEHMDCQLLAEPPYRLYT